MKLFKSSKQDEDLIKLLRKSRLHKGFGGQAGSDFEFDPDKVKYRLLSSINQTAQQPIRHFRFRRVVQYSVGFAGLVIAISTTFAFASTAKPGDKLFALNKFGEGVVLRLPLSVEQKAKVQEYIVTSRLEALDQVQEAKNLSTVKETDESLMSAVDAITENKKKLEASGKTVAAEKLEKVLDQLQIQAEKREAKIKKLEEETKDLKTKAEIRRHLRKIEESRKKAQAEIKRYQNDDDDRDED